MEKYFASRFKGIVIKMIQDFGGEFDDYLISPKLRQIFLDCCYEVTEKDFLPTQQINLKRFFSNIKHELSSVQQKRNLTKSKR